MGTYHKYKFRFNLKSDLPKEVDDVLDYLSGVIESHNLDELPNHPYFLDTRWCFIAHGSWFDCNDFYFVSTNEVRIEGSVKNIADTLDKFMDFIDPYIDEPVGTFLGAYGWDDVDWVCVDNNETKFTKFYKKDKQMTEQESNFYNLGTVTLRDNIDNNIYFRIDGKEPLTLTKDGFLYNGQFIEDAGLAHKLFIERIQ